MKNKIAYLFVIIFWLIVTTAFGQIQVMQFNAEWNKANEVVWFMELNDCKTKSYTDKVYNKAIDDMIKDKDR